jgi:hypothetical protein
MSKQGRRNFYRTFKRLLLPCTNSFPRLWACPSDYTHLTSSSASRISTPELLLCMNSTLSLLFSQMGVGKISRMKNIASQCGKKPIINR